MRKEKEDLIGSQYRKIETSLRTKNRKRAYQLVKDLTSENRVNPQLSRTGLGNVL